jgi:lysozyme family protein
MENIKDLIGEIITVDGVNKQLRITGARYVGNTVELTTEEVEVKEFSFSKAFEYILLVEGGYSDNKADGGGKTMYGITEIVARKYGYKGEMSKMSKSTAEDIYKKKYWSKNNLDKIKDFRIALSIFDWTVNSGTWGTKKAQTAVNKTLGDGVLKVDGIIGNNSIKYINEVDTEKFLAVYHHLQIAFYNSIAANNASQKIFLKGWLNRVDRKEKFIKNL